MNILLKRVVMTQAFDLFDPNKFESLEQYNEVMMELKKVYGFNELGILGIDVPMIAIMIGCIVLGIGLLVLSSTIMSKRIKKITLQNLYNLLTSFGFSIHFKSL